MRPSPTNDHKAEVWKNYHARCPTRVPLRLNTNPRIILLDPALNPRGFTFEQAATDPLTHIEVILEWQRHHWTTLNRFTDGPTGLPEEWDVCLYTYNVCEAAALGAPVQYLPGQVPATEPILNDANKRDIFQRDIEHPLEHGFYRQYLEFWREMQRLCETLRFEGRPVRLHPWAYCGTDGPVTVACNLRGTAFLTDLVEDPEYADKLLAFLTRAAILRRRAFWDYWDGKVSPAAGGADDSCAMLSPRMYTERVLPLHRRFYDAAGAGLPRSIHLCGNASHLFPIIHQQLNVTAFDTGYPIDHGKVRRELGPDVEIFGGPPVDLLLNGSTAEVYQRTQEILLSGVKEGGRFVLQEGNNLPPNCPLANLEAMYQACLDHGSYPGKSNAPAAVAVSAPARSIYDSYARLVIHRAMGARREEYLDYMTFRANQRPLFNETFGPLNGLREEWEQQGASAGELDFSTFRYRAPMFGHAPINTGWMGGGPEEILEETAEFIIARDRMGRRMKLIRQSATLPLPMDYPVRTMDDWRRIKSHYQFSEERFGENWEESVRLHQKEGRVVRAGIPGGFDEPRQLMGEEALCVAFYEAPDLIQDILQTISDTAFQVLERVSARIQIDQLNVHEDLAGKNGPLIGPKQVAEFVTPYYRRIWDLLQSRGTRLFYQDSDGDMSSVIPEFLRAGLNVMGPMEPVGGNDIVRLRQIHGTRLAFVGGIDKHVLRRTQAEITAELEYKIPPMIRTGGCILGLDHRIPNGTSLANYRFYIQKAWEIMERAS